MIIIEDIIDNIRQKDKRTSLAQKNIFLSFIIKGIAMFTSFIVVPLTLNYLDNEIYGIWLTISSILFWFTFFDVGLGSGMRNYLSAALSNKDFTLSKQYVSTTFALLLILAVILGLIIALIVPQINLNSLFNTNIEKAETLMQALLVALYLTLGFFVVRNVGTIYISMQLPCVNDALSVMGNIIGLIAIWIFSFYVKGSLLLVVSAFTLPPVLIFTFAAFPTFKKYKEICPSIHFINWNLSRNIIGKGLGFFFIQITSCLIIYGASNLFIAHFCGPTEVTNYGISYKYFNLLSIFYIIFLTPYWNAYTDAYVKDDMKWIKKTFNKTLYMWGFMSLLGGILIIIAPIFYKLWVGTKVNIEWTLSVSTLFYVCMYNLNNCVTFLINGVNKIYIQIISSIVCTLIYVIAVELLKGKFGPEGIVMCMGITYLIMACIHFFQCKLIINRKATGIWNK